jgi:rSAM/selenodomain-associated transferase 2
MALTFSVIVPVLGEEDLVNRLVDHIRTVGYGRNPEIVIADGHPERSTLSALARPGVLAVPAPRGRARQMNAGARHASGDVLVFLHADSCLPAGAFEAMERVLADGKAAGAFDLGIRSKRWSLELVARVASLRSRLTRVPYGDQAIFLTRQAFQTLQGYRDMPILEEVDLMRRLKRAGMRMGFAKGRAVTSPRRWEAEGVWRRTFINWAIIVLYLLGVPPEKLAHMHRPARPAGDGPGPCRRERRNRL